MDTSSDQSDKPEAARVFKMLRELEFATLSDVRDLFRAANEKARRMIDNGESAMDLVVEMGIIINTIQESLRRKTISLKNGVPRAPVETIYLPPAPTNGSSKLNKSKPPLQQRRPTRGKKANVSQVRLNATGINFSNLAFPQSDGDWEEIALAVVKDQGRVSLDNLFRLAKSGERVIHGFSTSTTFSDSRFRYFLEPVVYGLASHNRKNKKIRWTSMEEVELEWIGD